MVVKGMILLVIVLILVKYLGRFLAILLIRYGMPERKAAYSVTGLHIIVLLIGALVVLNLVGFPATLLFRVIMLIVMVSVAAFIIAKPFIPQLPFKKGNIIQVAGAMGIVDMITIMHTRVRTFDGKVIYIPNHKVLNDQVVNSSVRPNRRLDIDDGRAISLSLQIKDREIAVTNTLQAIYHGVPAVSSALLTTVARAITGRSVQTAPPAAPAKHHSDETGPARNHLPRANPHQPAGRQVANQAREVADQSLRVIIRETGDENCG